ncbi:MAG TPA: hypothetical protein VJ919_13595 [Tangfeifania sp.]|nr:hypothetical protein [Tangfeifania sp.]
MKVNLKRTIFFILIIISVSTNAQRTTEIGFTGGAIRFYPEAEFFSQSLNNQSKNGWGWSAGFFYEKHWKPKINPVLELNYSNFSSDFFLEHRFFEPETGNIGEPVSDTFRDATFSYLSASAGVKLYLNNKLFVYPGFEISKSLNRKTDLWSVMYYAKDWGSSVYIKNRYLNKTNYYAKLGLGVDLKAVDVMLEYVYGLNYQLSFYEYSTPFGVNHRNKYLQLKVQVPIYKFSKK